MEGSRVAKKEGGGGLLWIIAGVIAAAALGAYLGLCALAQSRDTILPNVTAAGVDVSNMTQAQAQAAVEQAARQGGSDISFTLCYQDLSTELNAGDVGLDAAQSAKEAYQIGRENFFTDGFKLLSHMMGASEEVPVSIRENDPALQAAVDALAQMVAEQGVDSGYELQGERLVMTKGAPVLTVDWDQVRADAEEKLQEALTDRLTQGGGAKSLTLQVEADQSEVEEPDFEAIHQALAVQPKDAQLDPKTFQISGETVGLDFDVNALKQAYSNAKEGETFSFPVTVLQPKVTKADLERKMFQDVLGEVTTNVSGSAARKSNVKLAAEACNNVILLPGEVFSYNDTTGPRTAAKGYKSAPAYYNGATVQEIGGGVCQPSSTIYYAVLHTNLEIVERHNHRYAVGYVPDGMDATVSYGGLDFKFKNSTDYPIKIVTSSYDASGKRKLNVKIYGTNVDGITVKPTNSVFNVVAPTVQYVPDPGVAPGALVLDKEQNAYRGRSAQTYRTIYAADGSKLEQQNLGVSNYKMRPTVYRYNPADGDPSTWGGGQPPANNNPPVDQTPVTPPVDPGITVPVDPVVPVNPEPAPDPVPEVPETPVVPEVPVTPDGGGAGTDPAVAA